ncbi:MAG: succinate dehydrogenase/fumarate reductase iron-sulfur subunit [Rhodothermaceae bacterium]|nr:succinate dehydrogenase/fumarate reductase iron-sulfur subunit [Rhodothermaceae bacterium]MYF62986.1 succinate dehydrogenase/fumarate reductase iron-sulfur subunit [Rhodothermaceae bacterium]MYI83952.1 succinate dehydrogenase/fumarate reductase iron-sulfur subunit [Rhodothermaceae bacterium]
MIINLRIWRQKSPEAPGKLVDYTVSNASEHMSFLELLDVLNEQLIASEDDPVEFDSDCREGICGSCGVMVAGIAHGPQQRTAVCQLHMRSFKDGDTITVEPFRARAFPIVRDLVVDRSSFDRIIAAHGYVSVKTGSAPDANAIPISKDAAEEAMDFAACIGCGACVAACPNGSASLFTAAKIAHLALLPQGQVEASRRAVAMVDQMEAEGFGDCSNYAECEAVCPKGISVSGIASMRRAYMKGVFSK